MREDFPAPGDGKGCGLMALAILMMTLIAIMTVLCGLSI